jgi:hypothetical protein
MLGKINKYINFTIKKNPSPILQWENRRLSPANHRTFEKRKEKCDC